MLRACPLILALFAACAPATTSGDGDTPDGGGPGPAPDLTVVPNPNAFWEKDPPLMMCGPDGVPMPPTMPPGGTPDCPDDKNREGCPCPTAGMKTSCWPGKRANRGLGICMDGQTTCMAGEVVNVWGPCQGYVLPQPGATGGAAACQCFSKGQWKVDYLVPCFFNFNNGAARGAISTVNGMCPSSVTMGTMAPTMPPPQPWSTNSVTVDCEGKFKLCYTIKAGDKDNPRPDDCMITDKPICTEAYYATKGQMQAFPPLPAWINRNAGIAACIDRFNTVGGYGEMTVEGVSKTCDTVGAPGGGPRVFLRLKFCPAICRDQPNRPECMNCGSGATGEF